MKKRIYGLLPSSILEPRWGEKMFIKTNVVLATLMLFSALSLLATGTVQSTPPTDSKGGGLGTGTLYVYINQQRTTLAPTNQAEHYIVSIQNTYYFTITDITEYTPTQPISIWACFKDQTELVGNFPVEQNGKIDFTWTIPDLPDQTEIKYKYGLSLTGPDPSWRFAKKTTNGVAMTFAVPEVQFGALGSLTAIFAALGLKNFVAKRKKDTCASKLVSSRSHKNLPSAR